MSGRDNHCRRSCRGGRVCCFTSIRDSIIRLPQWVDGSCRRGGCFISRRGLGRCGKRYISSLCRRFIGMLWMMRRGRCDGGVGVRRSGRLCECIPHPGRRFPGGLESVLSSGHSQLIHQVCKMTSQVTGLLLFRIGIRSPGGGKASGMAFS